MQSTDITAEPHTAAVQELAARPSLCCWLQRPIDLPLTRLQAHPKVPCESGRRYVLKDSNDQPMIVDFEAMTITVDSATVSLERAAPVTK